MVTLNEQHLDIAADWSEGQTYEELAVKYGCSVSQVCYALRQVWDEFPGFKEEGQAGRKGNGYKTRGPARKLTEIQVKNGDYARLIRRPEVVMMVIDPETTYPLVKVIAPDPHEVVLEDCRADSKRNLGGGKWLTLSEVAGYYLGRSKDGSPPAGNVETELIGRLGISIKELIDEARANG